MLWSVSEEVLTIPIILVVSRDWVSCRRGIWIISGGCRGSGEGFLKEAGRLGLGACQFGESERFGLGFGGSTWGGGSLQSAEGWDSGSRDLQEVRSSLWSAGGTYHCGLSSFERIRLRFRAGLVAVM
jgi:hypothetical protein